MKKFLAILLALIMVLGLVACGATTETKTETTETKTETTKTEEKKEETKEEETVEETPEEEWPMLDASALVFTSTGFTPPAESEGVDYYRDNYGLNLEVLPVDISSDEAWNIFWAGGGYADIILPYGGQGKTLVNEGLVRPIEYDWIKEYMPRLYTLLMQVYGTDEAALTALNINGETYCIPYFADTSTIGFNTVFRNDWLEAVGLEVYDGMTVAELEEIVRAFAEDDPDGNGVDDTYAFTALLDGYSDGLYSLAAAYGTSIRLSYYTAEDGKSMYSNANSDEYRTYMTKMAEWYQNGWIDPEAITDNRAMTRDKFAAGTIGILADNPWWWELDRGEVGPMQMLCATQGLEFANCVTFLTDIQSEVTGEPVHNSGLGSINGQASVYFGYETSDEVVIRMMKILNEGVRLFTFDEEDKQAILTYSERSWGHQGEHWEVDEIGRVVVTNPMTAEVQCELGQYMFPIAAASDFGKYEGRDDSWNKENYEKAMGMNRVYHGSDRPLPSLAGISTELADMSTNVGDYFTVSRSQFLTGELDITDDAVWAEYCAKLEELGINEIIAAFEESFGM